MNNKINRRTVLGSITAGGVAGLSGCLDTLTGGSEEYPSDPIDFETPNPPGGGSDAYVRALSPALSNEFGVNVNPLNQTPAEQRIPTLYNGGEDGYNVIHFNPTIQAWQIVENGRDTPFNPAQWQSLGAPNTSSLILTAGTHTGLENWDQLVSRAEEGETFKAALIGRGLGMYYDFIGDNSPVEFENISGYDGTGEIIGEIERENLDFYIAPAASLLSYASDDILRPILTGQPDVMGDFMLDQYADIGLDGIAETTYEEAGLGELATLVQSMRICLAPPGVPEDRYEVLRDSFWNTMNGDEFADAASNQNLPVNTVNPDDAMAILEEKADILTSL